ncbi:MAG: HIT domain-containing protein [Microbacterium sp.]
MEEDLACPLCRVIRTAGVAVEFENEHFVVVHPLEAKHPVHLLIIPRRHADSSHEFLVESAHVGGLLRMAAAAAERAGIRDSGYRLVLNSGPATDQTVNHPHMHLIGGHRLQPHP